MIKIICDHCGQEAKDPDFMCEMHVQEILTAIDSRSMNPSKQLSKKLIQLCRDCYKKKIEPLLKK